MKTRKYLITAAAGKTGKYLVLQLLAAGHAVRAMVRREDARSQALREAGAEVVVGDLLNHDDVIAATAGVDAAYLCYPVSPGFIQVTAYFADAARRAGLELVVNMSQISAREDALSHAARDHWIAERVLDWSGVPVVHLRPTFFSEWLIFPWVRDTILRHGEIRLPYGQGRHAPISAFDQARFIAAILVDPAVHAGQTYTLQGAAELDQHAIAAEVAKVLDRPVRYVPQSLEEYRLHLQGYPLGEFTIQHFCEVAGDYQNGIFAGTNHVIEQVTGQAPQSLEAFLLEHRQAFCDDIQEK